VWSDLLGKEYAEGAVGPDRYDCYGLCREIARRVGRSLPDLPHPSNLQETHELYLQAAESMRRLPAPAPFCAVAFMMRPPFVTHIGIVLEDCRRFIHILRKRSVAIERLDNPQWQRRIAGYYEPPVDPNHQSV